MTTMDFDWSDEQQALGGLARTILDDLATHERLSQLEAAGGAVFDTDLWRALADAGILGSVVPEAHGGGGFGLLELLPVLEEAGRHVAPVPLVETLVLGALAIAHLGDEGVQAALLPGVVDGSTVLTAAVEELHAAAGSPVGVARVQADGGRLSGELGLVPYAQHAARILVPAGGAVWLVDPAHEGVTVVPEHTTNRSPVADVRVDAVPAELLTDAPGAAAWIAERGAAATCAVQTGVCDAAVAMLARHTSSREQFGKPIGEFQAVAQRAADAFIDTELLRLVSRQAIFRLDRGWPATNEVRVACFWAGDGAMRVVHAAQHLHGGLGVDTDYPLHRYFLWAKQLEHISGTPTRELLRLGDRLADAPL